MVCYLKKSNKSQNNLKFIKEQVVLIKSKAF